MQRAQREDATSAEAIPLRALRVLSLRSLRLIPDGHMKSDLIPDARNTTKLSG